MTRWIVVIAVPATPGREDEIWDIFTLGIALCSEPNYYRNLVRLAKEESLNTTVRQLQIPESRPRSRHLACHIH